MKKSTRYFKWAREALDRARGYCMFSPQRQEHLNDALNYRDLAKKFRAQGE